MTPAPGQDPVRTPDRTLGYRPALDGLRAVAIALVLWHHAVAILAPAGGSLLAGGFLGVDIFFVLSGFLITSVLAESAARGGISLRSFYARRARRLLPALVVFLGAHGVLAVVQGRDVTEEAVTTLSALTYTSNLAPTFGWDLAPDQLHLWSLAVEEQFYLLWPLILLVLLRSGRGRVALGAMASIVVGVVLWRTALLDHHGAGYPIVYQRTDARLDALVIGAMLAVALHSGWRPNPWISRLAGWGGTIVVAGFAIGVGADADPLYRGGFTLVAIGAAGMILLALDGRSAFSRLLAHPLLVGVGRISYSLYLWHVLAYGLVAGTSRSPVTRITIGVTLAVVCAVISHVLVERPFLASWPPPVLPNHAGRSSAGRRVRRAGALPALGAIALVTVGAAGAAAQQAMLRPSVAPPDAEVAVTPIIDTPTDGRDEREWPDGPVAPPTTVPDDVGAREPIAIPPSDTAVAPTTAPPVTVELAVTTLTLDRPVPQLGPAAEPGLRVSARLAVADAGLTDVPVAFEVRAQGVTDTCSGRTDGFGVVGCFVAIGGGRITGDLRVRAKYAGSEETTPVAATWPLT